MGLRGWDGWAGALRLPMPTCPAPASVRIIGSVVIKQEEFLSLPAGMRAAPSLSVFWEFNLKPKTLPASTDTLPTAWVN